VFTRQTPSGLPAQTPWEPGYSQVARVATRKYEKPGTSLIELPTSFNMQKMAVTVPAGMQGGMALKVQTPSGMMQVTIPNGLRAGQEFHMMVPAPAPPMGQPAYGQPTGQPMGPVMGQVVGAPSQGQPMYPQQQPMYPAQQPQMAQPMMYGQQPQMVQQPMQYPQQPQMMQQPMYYQQQPQQVVVQQQPQVIYQQQPQVIYQQQPQVIHHHVGGGPVYNRGIDGGDVAVGVVGGLAMGMMLDSVFD